MVGDTFSNFLNYYYESHYHSFQYNFMEKNKSDITSSGIKYVPTEWLNLLSCSTFTVLFMITYQTHCMCHVWCEGSSEKHKMVSAWFSGLKTLGEVVLKFSENDSVRVLLVHGQSNCSFPVWNIKPSWGFIKMYYPTFWT